MDKAERQKLILIGILILGVGYFGYNGIGAFGGVAGVRAEAEKLQAERDDLHQQVQNAQAMLANLGRIKKEREALEVQLKELSRRLPSEPESAEMLRNVEVLASKSGLVVGIVRHRTNRPQELYTEIPLEISVGGGYYDLLKFADELAKLPRLATLNEIKMENRSGAPPAGPAAPAGADLTPGRIGAQLVTVVFQATGGGTKP
jgi:type IV pilus assembly protein PilO